MATKKDKAYRLLKLLTDITENKEFDNIVQGAKEAKVEFADETIFVHLKGVKTVLGNLKKAVNARITAVEAEYGNDDTSE